MTVICCGISISLRLLICYSSLDFFSLWLIIYLDDLLYLLARNNRDIKLLRKIKKKERKKENKVKLCFGFTVVVTKQIMMAHCPALCCHNCVKVQKMPLLCPNLLWADFKELPMHTIVAYKYISDV